MGYVLAAIGVCAFSNLLVAVAFLGAQRGRDRQQARERERLIDQLCHMAGHTWTPPPSETPWPRMSYEPEVDLVAAPEQHYTG